MRVDSFPLKATTLAYIFGLASIRLAALTLLLSVPVVVLLTAASTVILLALVMALVGGTLASHTSHELLEDVGDLVHVSGVDRAFAIFVEITLEVLLVLNVLVFKVALLFD